MADALAARVEALEAWISIYEEDSEATLQSLADGAILSMLVKDA